MKIVHQQSRKSSLPFEVTAVTALVISIVADILDYVGAPILDLPIVGDIPNAIIIVMLYRLTGSKISAAINALKFIPFVGDLIPTYTISTAIWIIMELRRRKDISNRQLLITSSNKMGSV